jgi:tetratricopeptide (TPR) repeat protein
MNPTPGPRLFLLPLLAIAASAQTAAPPVAFAGPPEALQQAFAGIEPGTNPVTVLLEEAKYDFDAAGLHTYRYRSIFKVWTKAGAESWAIVQQNWAPWKQERPVVRARVVGADGSVHELDPKTAADSPVRDGDDNVLTDRRMVRVPLPAVQPGSVIEEEIVVRQTALTAGAGAGLSFYFGNSVPVQRTHVEIRVPETLPLRFKTYLLPGTNVSDRKTYGVREVTFDQGPMKPLDETPPLLPPGEARSPHIAFSTAQDWNSLATGYSAIVEKQIKDFKAAPHLPKFAAGATRGTKTAAILEKLNREIRYTGIEFAEASVVPRSPAEVIQRKYGDCKDKSTLAVALLRAAGIDAYVALLFSSSGNDIDPDLPGIDGFNHAIVYVPGSPGLWLDPTDPDLRLSVLSPGNQGRYAMVARPTGGGLIRTPELTAAENQVIETREFDLAELGGAKVVETSELSGTPDRSYRGTFGDKDEKALRESLKSYISNTYGEAKVVRITHGEEPDLGTPFTLKIELENAQRGTTARSEAAVGIFMSAIAERLPAFFREDPKQEEKAEKDKDKPAPAPRTQDFYISEPFTYEWRYRIRVPAGFRLRQLPEAKEEKLGPATLTVKFASEGEMVSGTIRFVMPKRRFSAAEGLALRDAVVELGKRKAMLIYFDQVGEALLASGKVKEALAEFDRLRRLHPKEAAHHLQTARALLAAGAGEAARVEARQAVAMEPASARAQVQLAEVLKHDLVGRSGQQGWDHAGAVAAYRKALELDPSDAETRINLAILLEYNRAAMRYTRGAQLEASVAEYKQVLPKLASFGVAQNYPIVLFQAGMMQALRDHLSSQPDTELNQTLAVCAEAVLKGSKAALDRAGQVSGTEARQKVLANAGQWLISARRYDLAADLVEAGSAGSQNPAALANLIQILRKTKAVDDMSGPAKTPEDAVRILLSRIVKLEAHEKDWSEPLSDLVVEEAKPEDLKTLRREMARARTQLQASGIGLDAGYDLMQSAIQFSHEGSDEDGYVVHMTSPSSGGAPTAENQVLFVAREHGTYRIVALYGEFSGAARMVLDLANMGKVREAKIWLDRIRREVHAGSGDDPLSGPLFARLWQQGQAADIQAVKSAAAALLTAPNKRIEPIIKILEQGAAGGGAGASGALSAALVEAYLTAKQYAKAEPLATSLLKALPQSPAALSLALRAAYAAGGRSAANAILSANLQRFTQDVEGLRSAATIAMIFGDTERSGALEKQIVDSGRGTANDFNQIAWGDLMAGKVTAATLESANRGMLIANNQSTGLMHTLAAVYAELGKESDARATLLQRMAALKAAEPDDDDWYVFGRIAEQYGLQDAAAGMYRRLARPANELAIPASSYALARKRLQAMGVAGE